MADESFKIEVARIREYLENAILTGDVRAFGQTSRALRRQWAIALVQNSRTQFRLVNEAMLSVADMAYSYANPNNPNDPLTVWHQVWAFCGEAGLLIQEMHIDWTAEEQLLHVDLNKFQYAAQTLRFLDQKGLVPFSKLLAHMEKAITHGQTETNNPNTQQERKRLARSSLNNHVRRLVKHGLVVRTGWGLYRLTMLGEQAAKLLKEGDTHLEKHEETLELEFATATKTNKKTVDEHSKTIEYYDNHGFFARHTRILPLHYLLAEYPHPSLVAQ